jgi:predicted nucleotidyltransferase
MGQENSPERKEKKETSVEQNISSNYVSKSKLGNLPMQNPLETEMQKKMDEMKQNLEKFKKEAVKQFKFIEAIGLVPQQANKKIEEEYEISEEDGKRGLIHVLTIIPEEKFKEIQKIKLELIKIGKQVDNKIWIHLMTPVDMWNLCLDSKFDIAEALAMSYPILDKGLLGALRVTQIHKSLVLKKFEKYITSYGIYGSLVRAETKPTSDVDVAIIIDDTDVKRMPRLELKEKLRSIIFQYIQEAEALAGVKNKLSPQVWLLTEFWEGVKDAQPVFFTFIRDGIPIYDRGTFLPWKSLLRMGKIKPSPEAIDMFMSSGDKLKETIERRIFDIATLDLFWGTSTPTQGILMLYGLTPPTPKETVRIFREVFVEKEKLIEPKYADILEEIIIKVWKKYEHGKLKPGDINGKELDRLSKNAIDYIKRLKELRKQIETRVQEKSIEKVYEDTFGMVGAILNKKQEKEILSEFEKEMVKKGKFPKKFLDNLKFIAKVRKEVLEEKKKKSVKKTKDKSKKKIDLMSGKEINEVDQARKLSAEIINSLIEHNQRCEMLSLDRTRFLIKTADRKAEVFFLNNTFVIEKETILKVSGDSLKETNLEELNKALSEQKNKKTSINPDSIEILKKEFGEFELEY